MSVVGSGDMVLLSCVAGPGGSGSCTPPTHIQAGVSRNHTPSDTGEIRTPGAIYHPRSGTQGRELRFCLAARYTTFAISGRKVRRRMRGLSRGGAVSSWVPIPYEPPSRSLSTYG